MGTNAIYERDLLYPTESLFEPGSIHVEMYGPTQKGKIPVVIESKTAHSPVKHINAILRVMQSDIFDRILVDIKANVSLYIKANEGLKKEASGKDYLSVAFEGDKIEFKTVDDIDR